MMHWTVQSYFSRFLNAGVKIYLFQEGFIHSKVILSMIRFVPLRTANLRYPKILELNFEVNALIYNKEVTMTMKKQVASFQKNSRQLTLRRIYSEA